MHLINQLSKHTQLPIHTIRYYEKYGLFKGKKNAGTRSNNYTYYDEEVIEKLELVKEAKALGFTLSEIKRLVDAWHSKKLSIEKKKEILELKVEEIDNKILHLKNMKKLITQGIKDVEEFGC